MTKTQDKYLYSDSEGNFIDSIPLFKASKFSNIVAYIIFAGSSNWL